MDVSKNRGTIICYLMVILSACLAVVGNYLGLKATSYNGIVVAIGLCLIVSSAYKEEK